MSVKHHLITHRPGAICGVSCFVEGRKPTVTVVVTELPDNPGSPARESFETTVNKIRGALLKRLPGSQVAWLHRTPRTSNCTERIEIAHLDEDGNRVARWEAINPAQLGIVVNREGGFTRRAVFIPSFKPLQAHRDHGRPKEIVTYVSD